MITVGSMFAGVGGVCLGFKQAGADVKWANEFDKYAQVTYTNNFPTTNLSLDDVRIVDPNDLGYVDIITSGFPCQAFSIAGYRQGFDDEKGRGNLFFETARFIEKLKPRAFLLENVKNLVTHDNGNTFKVIKETITKDLDYSFIPFVLNAKDYGNIPQTRERIYVVGFRNEGSIDYNPEDGLFTSESITNSFQIPSKIELTKSIQDVIHKDKQEEKFYYTEMSYLFNELVKSITRKDTVYQWRRKYVRENKSNVCPTLTANMGTGGHNVPLILDNYGIRKLTPRECFSFQGFPDDYLLPSMISNSHLYKQAGNSVVVSVIQRIAKEILKALSNN